MQWADVTLAAGHAPILRTVKPHVVVTIGIDDLADPHTGQGTAQTGFGARISAARARWLACDGNITRIIIGPEGQPLDLGRSRRVYPAHLRTGVEIRDRHCVFTGCDAPSYWCDVHHVLEWVLDDGPTSVGNGALLCERHSHLVCTTASPSNDNPTADGAPGDPTAPRSSCTPSCPPPERTRSPAAQGCSPRSQGRTISSGHCCCQRWVLVS